MNFLKLQNSINLRQSSSNHSEGGQHLKRMIQSQALSNSQPVVGHNEHLQPANECTILLDDITGHAGLNGNSNIPNVVKEASAEDEQSERANNSVNNQGNNSQEELFQRPSVASLISMIDQNPDERHHVKELKSQAIDNMANIELDQLNTNKTQDFAELSYEKLIGRGAKT